MLTWQQAARLSNDPVRAGIFKSAYAIDPLFKLIPWARVIGKGHTYIREGSQISADFITSGGSITSTQQVPQSITAQLRTIAASAQIPGDAARNLNDNFDQVAVQQMHVARALARHLEDKLINGTYPTVTLSSDAPTGFVTAITGGPNLKAGTGQMWVDVSANGLYFQAPGDSDFGAVTTYTSDGNYTVVSADGVSKVVATLDVSEEGAADAYWAATVSSSTYEFDGLTQLVDNTTAAGTNGAAISLVLLRTLIDMVDPASGQLALIMPKRTKRAIKSLYDALGGTQSEHVELPDYGISGQFAFEGVPIFVNDYLPLTETQGSSGAVCGSVYCVSFAPASGLASNAPLRSTGLCGLYGAGSTVETDNGPTMGVNVVMDDKPRDGDGKLMDAVEVAVMGDYGLMLGSTYAAARLTGVTN